MSPPFGPSSWCGGTRRPGARRPCSGTLRPMPVAGHDPHHGTGRREEDPRPADADPSRRRWRGAAAIGPALQHRLRHGRRDQDHNQPPGRRRCPARRPSEGTAPAMVEPPAENGNGAPAGRQRGTPHRRREWPARKGFARLPALKRALRSAPGRTPRGRRNVPSRHGSTAPRAHAGASSVAAGASPGVTGTTKPAPFGRGIRHGVFEASTPRGAERRPVRAPAARAVGEP